MSLTDQLLKAFEFQLTSVELIPSKGGVFEVSLDGNLLFSKRELGRHAEPGEILRLLEARLTRSE